jgi:RNA polymerase sigma-70 factor (ECF subfamily)
MGISIEDEPELWDRVRNGDPAAFGALFDTHRDRVYGQALRLTRSVHDAEDVTALVFLEAWRRRESVRVVNESIVAWLLVTTNFVAKNVLRTLRRHRIAMAKLPPSEPTRDFAQDSDERLDGYASTAGARDAFARLSKKDQDVITLCVLEEMTVAGASDALGIPPGTVKSRLSRAKRRMAQVMTESASAKSALGGA